LDLLIAYFTPLSQNWRVAAYRHVSAQALYNKEAFKGVEKELAGIRNIPGDPLPQHGRDHGTYSPPRFWELRKGNSTNYF
jgi:hypothetical protein